jgi:hypothetical protein
MPLDEQLLSQYVVTISSIKDEVTNLCDVFKKSQATKSFDTIEDAFVVLTDRIDYVSKILSILALASFLFWGSPEDYGEIERILLRNRADLMRIDPGVANRLSLPGKSFLKEISHYNTNYLETFLKQQLRHVEKRQIFIPEESPLGFARIKKALSSSYLSFSNQGFAPSYQFGSGSFIPQPDAPSEDKIQGTSYD